MKTSESNQAQRVSSILNTWGHASPGLPSQDTWNAIARLPVDQPVTLINFFKMRAKAEYSSSHADAHIGASGQDAFNLYAKVSLPSVEAVGGRFLLVAPFWQTFIGKAEDWDLVAIGTYPDPDALLSLFELDDYRAAYLHRVAACSDQRVSLCMG